MEIKSEFLKNITCPHCKTTGKIIKSCQDETVFSGVETTKPYKHFEITCTECHEWHMEVCNTPTENDTFDFHLDIYGATDIKRKVFYMFAENLQLCIKDI